MRKKLRCGAGSEKRRVCVGDDHRVDVTAVGDVVNVRHHRDAPVACLLFQAQAQIGNRVGRS